MLTEQTLVEIMAKIILDCSSWQDSVEMNKKKLSQINSEVIKVLVKCSFGSFLEEFTL